jgi:tripartite-type tricarboxylate transporter receptor subunit TctC
MFALHAIRCRQPEILVQYMPGAASLVAANYVYMAKPDGLTLGMVQYNIFMDHLVGRKEVQFDVRKFVWIGSPAVSWAAPCW